MGIRVNNDIRKQQIAILEKVYADAVPALKFNSPFELLVAVILSAQCTDIRVNEVTKELFAVANTPEKILELGEEKLADYIHSCGLYRIKAKRIIDACQMLVDKFNSEVPNTFDDLLKLPGVGRKTANVVVSIAFDVPAIAVDTHVFRVANRLKLAKGDYPNEVEDKLKEVIPREKWSAAHHWLLWHGRKVCKAARRRCLECPLVELCPSRRWVRIKK